MNDSSLSLYEIVNSAVADLLLIDATDKGPLGEIIAKMERVTTLVRKQSVSKIVSSWTETISAKMIPVSE